MHRCGLQPSMERACTQEWGQHLAGVHRNWREGSLSQRHRGAQQVPGVSSFLLVLSAVFHLQLLFRQNSFIARSIARWREKFKFSVPPPKQEAHPEKDRVGVNCVSGCTEDSPSTRHKEHSVSTTLTRSGATCFSSDNHHHLSPFQPNSLS